MSRAGLCLAVLSILPLSAKKNFEFWPGAQYDPRIPTLHQVLGYDPEDKEGWRVYTEYTKFVLEPLTHDGPLQLTSERAREAVAFLVRHGKKLVFRPDDPLPNLPKPIKMPTDHTFVNRLQWGLASVMGGLRAEADWRKITSTWLRR